MDPVSDASTPSGRDAAEETLRLGLAQLEANRDRVYFDVEADAAARARFYAPIDPDTGPAELRLALSTLLESTHRPRPFYKPAEHVYPWVDLHPDGRLHSIYSGLHVDAEEFIRADAEIARQRGERLQDTVRREATLGPREFEAAFDALERELPFNCEHVVPQSWFAQHEPMRGDLHHLFACEPHCNTFRANTPFADLADTEGKVVSDCGHSTPTGFEPTAGKGPIARATLYFLLRYPGQVGDEARELQRAALPVLIGWHAEHPVGEYERHRNAAIAEAQGNRNPLIDFPELAERISFEVGFGR